MSAPAPILIRKDAANYGTVSLPGIGQLTVFKGKHANYVERDGRIWKIVHVTEKELASMSRWETGKAILSILSRCAFLAVGIWATCEFMPIATELGGARAALLVLVPIPSMAIFSHYFIKMLDPVYPVQEQVGTAFMTVPERSDSEVEMV